MINCIRAELFRLGKDKLPLASFAFVLIGFIITTILAGGVDKLTQSQFLMSGWIEQYFSTARFAVLIFYYVWYQEHKYDTRKNICTSGAGICSFYVAKLFVQFLISAVFLVWTVLCFTCCFLMLKSDGAELMPLINERIRGLGIFALYITAEISVINCLFTYIKNEASVFLLFILVVDNLGSISGAVSRWESVYTISLEAGFDFASKTGISHTAMCVSAVSMIIHTIVVNLLVLLKLKGEVNYERKI